MAGVITHRALVIVGGGLLIIGGLPGNMLPPILTVHAMTLGGALLVIAAIRYALALLIGLQWATIGAGLIAVAQYVVTGLIPMHQMFHYWSATGALAGLGLLAVFSAMWLGSRWTSSSPAQ